MGERHTPAPLELNLPLIKKTKKPISEHAFKQQMESQIGAGSHMLRINSGHLDTLAANPAGKYVLSSNDISLVGEENNAVLLASVSGEVLLERVQALQGEQQREGLSLLVYIFQNEALQKNLGNNLNIARLTRRKPEKRTNYEKAVLFAERDVQQLNVIQWIDTAFTNAFGDQYTSADTDRYGELQKTLTEFTVKKQATEQELSDLRQDIGQP